MNILEISSLNSLKSNPLDDLPHNQKFEDLTYETLDQIIDMIEENREDCKSVYLMIKSSKELNLLKHYRIIRKWACKNNDLTDEIPTIRGRIGLNKVAKAYKSFLWFRYETRRDGNKTYAQYILTDPLTLEDIFITEKHPIIKTTINTLFTFFVKNNYFKLL